MKQNKLRTLYEKDMTKKILASLLSILIGLVVGSVIIAAVGFSNPELGASSVWDGFRLVFAGLFSTGRTAATCPFPPSSRIKSGFLRLLSKASRPFFAVMTE